MQQLHSGSPSCHVPVLYQGPASSMGHQRQRKKHENVGRNVWNVGLLKPGNREVQNPDGKGGQTWCQLRQVMDLSKAKAPHQ